MRRTLAFLAVMILLLGAVPTASSTQAQEATEASSCVSTAVSPPCGWINPQLYLDLPGNVRCGAGAPLGSDIDGGQCLTPPTEGKPLVMEGTFRLTWEVSEEGAYANDPNDPIVVDFNPTGSNPDFIDFSVEPSTYELGSETLFNPTNYVTKENDDGSESIWYEYTAPVTVTFTRDGDPTEEDVEDILNRDGQVRVLIRIHSDSSGSTYKDSYGLESFVFHVEAAQDDPGLEALDMDSESKGAPLPSVVWVLAAVAAAAVAIRRRI